MNIITEYPLWFTLFCLLAGGLYAGVLYYKDKRLNEISKWLIRTMAAFRFIVVSLLCFLLLSPLLRSVVREVEKPVIIIAQDNSESLISGKDSAYYRAEYKQQMNALAEELSGKYEVKIYSIADGIKERSSLDSLLFNEKQTDISSLFEELETRYSNRNVGAVVLATDGIYNQGTSPLYATGQLKQNIYTIGLGDTTIKKDLILSKVEHNRMAYLGNQFPLEVIINAKRLKGKNSVLTVSKDGQVLFTRPLPINQDVFDQTVPVLLEAKQVGLQRYRIALSSVEGEMTLLNNTKDIFIDVLDARQKVLILAEAPHPDLAAIKQSIENNQNYEVESFLSDNFNGALKKYDLVILHQILNSRTGTNKLLSELENSGIPVWVFSGANTILKKDISVAGTTSKINEVEPLLDVNFPLFTLSDELKLAVKDFPAIASPYSNASSDISGNALFYQRIGIVDTKNPLMSFYNRGDTKLAIFSGEGIWRWRLQDYASHGNHNVFDELITKTVQYLSLKMDKSFFRVIAKNNFFENESIELEAEVYNDSYELINDGEVEIVITNAENKKYPFVFSKTNTAYRLNAGSLPVGEYKYEAKTKVGAKVYSQKGSFSVSSLQIEYVNTVADHQLLYNLAKQHNGDLIYPKDLHSLAEKLNAREDIKPVSYSEKKLTDLINLKWLFVLLLIFLSAEWFIRKRNGAY
ncbi:MAG: hypothetical protein IT234_01505 [Bacteroidia bacterium]|nr:hypothetical protein [Bacteroidia bacterium]